MPTFEPGDVVKIPFPCGEKTASRFRPALVVSSGELQELHGLLWVLMITSAGNRRRTGDVEIRDLARAGLPAPSVVRCAKIATIEAGKASAIGRLETGQWKWVCSVLERVVGTAAGP
jgi:mRNA interferase MazF